MPSPSACHELPPLIAAMTDPSFYPHAANAVEVIQTHISYILLVGDFAYKVKKPVRFSFLDFSTAAARRHFCEEEVRLNRRLGGDMYIGVTGIAASGGAFILCEATSAEALEFAVVMRRLPADGMLATRLRRGTLQRADLDRVVARLAAFYAAADDGPEVRAEGSPESVLRWMRIDFAEMGQFRDDTIAAHDDEAIASFCTATMRALTPLLARRAAGGRVREGHGDLHADNIWFDREELLVFDCIEFNRAFRCRDVASDVAFLVMDLELAGESELASYFITRFADATGDVDLPRLMPLFVCHRAYIRGKVESLKQAEREVPAVERAAARDAAARHFALAYRLTWRYARVLVVVMGLSGSGKTALAAAVGERTGMIHLNSDRVRKQQAGLAATSRVGAGDDAWLYSPSFNARTYDELFARAEGILHDGGSVIIDATCSRRADRDRARELARSVGVGLCIVECRVAEDEARQRLERRAARDDDASDATEQVREMQRVRFEVVDPAIEGEVLCLDTGAALATNSRAVESRLLPERLKNILSDQLTSG